MGSTAEKETVLEDNDRYRILLASDQSYLLLDWKQEAGLGLEDFRNGVADFAGRCKTHRPARALIDARQLDPGGTALGWVSGRETPSGEEEYLTWWVREIVPVYHDAGISSLAVATGNPNAPGALSDLPPGVSFGVGYFPDLDSAKEWQND